MSTWSSRMLPVEFESMYRILSSSSLSSFFMAPRWHDERVLLLLHVRHLLGSDDDAEQLVLEPCSA